ncbi:MAG: phosphoenolpyruvate carboxylase [Verrucomicrobiota bacterium]
MSSRSLKYIEIGFSKIDRDLEFLMNCFKEVLDEIGEKEAAQSLPWLKDSDVKTTLTSEKFSQVLSVSFQILNLLEENAAAQLRRQRANEPEYIPEPGLWTYYLTQLKQEGFTEDQILETIATSTIEPVLTAHPTEAKRSTVLAQYRQLYLLIVERENQMWTPWELETNRQQIKVVIEHIWRAGELIIRKPEVTKERKGMLYYFREVFPAALPKLDTRLRQAWSKAGLTEAKINEPQYQPRFKFGTWVGGDRDGHPFVTPEVTRETLNELRTQALFVIHDSLTDLPRKVSLNDEINATPEILSQSIERITTELGDIGETICKRCQNEPWKQMARLIMAKLPVQINEEKKVVLDENEASYSRSEEVIDDLMILRDALEQVGAHRMAEYDVNPIIRTMETFGFHLAVLDIRQNSKFHDKAITQLMVASGIDASGFANWPEPKRLELLERELKSPRPFLNTHRFVGDEANNVLGYYSVLVEHIGKYGSDGLGSLIISMTRQTSDLYVVYLLAREAGLAVNTPNGLTCMLPVVPLFETLDDLQSCRSIIHHFIHHPVTKNTLEYCCKMKHEKITQQVMIGYSDSNKDAGIMASQWGVHLAERDLNKEADATGIRIKFFHGRGGTISRGAGPTHRFLEAMPHGTLTGALRVTEQGEVIAQKYANQITATFNLELLSAGTVATTLRHKRFEDERSDLDNIANLLASFSAEKYKSLLKKEGFIDFYGQATPIDALEQSRIGSRPARRTGVRSLEDLRAIPWVFSWTQSRFYLPGWYGVGTALEKLSNENEELYNLLKKEIKTWRFMRYVLSNVETNIASADMNIAQEYASLVEDPDLRDNFYTDISSEWGRSRKMLDDIFGGEELKKRRPRMFRTLALREKALNALHDQQINLLREWRVSKTTQESSDTLKDVLLSINAIAGGLRTTG